MSGKNGRILAAVFLAPFLISAEFQVLSVALPTIIADLQTTLSLASLTVIVYMITLIGGTLAAGALADRFGQARVTRWAFLGFAVLSVACGLSRGIGWLIFWRGLQGLCGSFLYVSGPAIVRQGLPAGERDRGFSLLAMAGVIGSLAGPTLGSVITAHCGWPWVFHVNVPVCLAGWWMLLPVRDAPAAAGARFDRGGALLSMLFSATLVFGLNQGTEFGWTSWPIVSSLVAAATLLPLFFWHESRTPHPVFDLSFLGNRPFIVGSAGLSIFLLVELGTTFLWPFYLIYVGGYSTERAGLLVVIRPAAMLVASLVAGRWLAGASARRKSVCGVVLALAGCLLFELTDIRSGFGLMAAVLALLGAGMGLYYPVAMKEIMLAAPEEKSGEAAAAMSLMRSFAQMLGVLLFELLYSDLCPDIARVAHMQHSFHAMILVAFALLLPSLAAVLAVDPQPKP